MKFALSIVLFGANAIAAPEANAVDRHEQLVAKMKERDPEIRRMTLDVLRKKNVDYQRLAMRRLEDDGEIFDRSRIEVTGVNASDNTAEFDPSLFDEPPIQPSFTAKDTSSELFNKLWRKINPTKPIDFALDIADYRSASNGEMTKRTRALFADWKNREINEVVAHSWGCEAVYAAIVNGYMRPPKKLILTGVPDNSFVKWQLLAKYTGTEVLWVRADNDKVAADLGTRIGNNKSWAEWNLDWESICVPERRAEFCGKRPASKATKVPIGKLPSLGGHNRDEYYVVLKQKKKIVGTPLDLRRAESNRKAAEIAEIERTEVEAAHRDALSLVALARKQRKIAERDHDDRLRYAYADLARRSCANPGSVTQTELNSLPEPYDESFVGTPPGGLGECAFMVYLSLGRGVDASEIQRKSAPAQPLDIPPPPQVARQAARTPLATTSPSTPFSSSFPLLKELAVTACSAPSRVSVEDGLIRPNPPYFFSSDLDNQKAMSVSAGLADCPRSLFYKLIETIRTGSGAVITNEWVRQMAAAYAPGYVVPPSRGPRCEDFGNKNCPCEDGTPGCIGGKPM